VHGSINNGRRPIPKNGPIRLDRRPRLVDDVVEDGVGGVELRYPGYELHCIHQLEAKSKMDGRIERRRHEAKPTLT
jgi:hypothetical protein